MCDLIVVGAGSLGMLVAKHWRQSHPRARVTLKFRNEETERSNRLKREGFSVISKARGESCRAPLVVFCAPPTGNAEYVQDIRSCVETHWNNLDPESAMVFTSAGSVYRENSAGLVDEMSETVETERSAPLLTGEKSVLQVGGCALRLGGLYTQHRGPHIYWSKGGQFPSRPSGLINLLHYEDAAQAVLKCLEHPHKIRGELFLVSDGVPVSRKQIVSAAGVADKAQFTGDNAIDGKKYDICKFRTTLGWLPIYPSFELFFEKF